MNNKLTWNMDKLSNSSVFLKEKNFCDTLFIHKSPFQNKPGTRLQRDMPPVFSYHRANQSRDWERSSEFDTEVDREVEIADCPFR